MIVPHAPTWTAIYSFFEQFFTTFFVSVLTGGIDASRSMWRKQICVSRIFFELKEAICWCIYGDASCWPGRLHQNACLERYSTYTCCISIAPKSFDGKAHLFFIFFTTWYMQGPHACKLLAWFLILLHVLSTSHIHSLTFFLKKKRRWIWCKFYVNVKPLNQSAFQKSRLKKKFRCGK